MLENATHPAFPRLCASRMLPSFALTCVGTQAFKDAGVQHWRDSSFAGPFVSLRMHVCQLHVFGEVFENVPTQAYACASTGMTMLLCHMTDAAAQFEAAVSALPQTAAAMPVSFTVRASAAMQSSGVLAQPCTPAGSRWSMMCRKKPVHVWVPDLIIPSRTNRAHRSVSSASTTSLHA
jgi:hypothetical protein